MSIPYFDRYLEKHHFKPHLSAFPSPNTGLIIVIPCFNEPDILISLDSLWSCLRSQQSAEIIVVLNYPEDSADSIVSFHLETLSHLRLWAAAHEDEHFRCHIIEAPDLPKKFAGVGLSRKTGMDEAIYRFSYLNNENGIICGFDADSAVDPNYLRAVENHFKAHPKTPGASIYYEHPISEITDPRFQSGIVQYEIHLRYLVNCIRYTEFPNSFHTVGSSFAVKAEAYVKQGGMNRFKAGEDFYFLNKIISLGGYTEINDTRVIPSPRISNRVPFGTGASMTKWMESSDQDFLTYSFRSFIPLKDLFHNIAEIYQQRTIPEIHLQHEVLRAFLEDNEWKNALAQILNNSGSCESFCKRFYAWFDAFKIVKYINFAALNGFPKQPVGNEAPKLLASLSIPDKHETMPSLLDAYRQLDRNGNNRV